MLIGNKCDLTGTKARIGDLNGFRHITVSAKQETGVQALIEAITAHAGFQPEEDTFIARTRHLDAMKRTQMYLAEAREQLVVYNAGNWWQSPCVWHKMPWAKSRVILVPMICWAKSSDRSVLVNNYLKIPQLRDF